MPPLGSGAFRDALESGNKPGCPLKLNEMKLKTEMLGSLIYLKKMLVSISQHCD